MKTENILKSIAALIFVALAIMFFLALAPPAECQGSWCPPIDCYGGDCAECVCIRDSYPDPGYCVSLDG